MLLSPRERFYKAELETGTCTAQPIEMGEKTQVPKCANLGGMCENAGRALEKDEQKHDQRPTELRSSSELQKSVRKWEADAKGSRQHLATE